MTGSNLRGGVFPGVYIFTHQIVRSGRMYCIYASATFARWQHHEMRSGLSIANVDTAAEERDKPILLVLDELIES